MNVSTLRVEMFKMNHSFILNVSTLRIEMFKMNHSLQQIELINAPESDRIVTSSSRMIIIYVSIRIQTWAVRKLFPHNYGR